MKNQIQVSDLFNSNYYRQANKDVAKAGVDPLLHFLQFGEKEGRSAAGSTTTTTTASSNTTNDNSNNSNNNTDNNNNGENNGGTTEGTPVNTVPSAQTATGTTELPLAGFAVADSDSTNLTADGNQVTLINDFVQSADNSAVTLNHSAFTITMLDTSALDANDGGVVFVNGAGAVTLADNGGNAVSISDATGGSIIGGSGDDSITGGGGQDMLAGGDGNDQFVYTELTQSATATFDTISDFDDTADELVLTGLGFTAIAEGAANGTTLGYSSDGTDTTIGHIQAGAFRAAYAG